MPMALLAVVGGILGLLLFQWRRITGDILLGAFYAVAGGAAGLMLAARYAGGLGPLGTVVAASCGAAVVLYLSHVPGRYEED